jgi:hypothetical protein
MKILYPLWVPLPLGVAASLLIHRPFCLDKMISVEFSGSFARCVCQATGTLHLARYHSIGMSDGGEGFFSRSRQLGSKSLVLKNTPSSCTTLDLYPLPDF